MAQILKCLGDFIFANISVLLFKAPQVCPVALLPAASAGLHCTRCQIVMRHFYYDVGVLLFGLCAYENNRVNALTDRMWSVRSGWCTQVDAQLYTTEIFDDLQAGGGLAEMSRPAESSRAVFRIRIKNYLLTPDGSC